MFDLVKNVLFAGVGAAFLTKEKAEEIVNDLISKGQLSKEEKTKKVKELMEKAEEKVKELSSYLEAQVKKTMDSLRATERKEMEDLQAKVADLQSQLDELKASK